MNPTSLTRLLALTSIAAALVACSSDTSRYAGSGTTASPYGSSLSPSMPEPAPSTLITEPGQGALAPTLGSGGVAEEVAQQVQMIAQSVIGMPESEAVNTLESNPDVPITTRIVHRDGEDFPVTTDFSPTRVNLWIDGGNVSKVSVG